MPRENRKRGKKHKKRTDEEVNPERHDAQLPDQHTEDYEEPQAGPSWIVPASSKVEVNPEAPFGYVDAEVKAYFRTVDLQIRDWQEQGTAAEDADEDIDPNEDRRLFFVAALTEMSGKEKQLATDPDCSSIMERMAYSMDDFVRRVFVDRLSGSFEQLVRHRFASHVCQTLFTVASDTVARECRGVLPSPPESSEDGELRTLTQLILETCEELLPSLPSLVMDPFASHVIRALLLLLAPVCFPPGDGHSNGASVRSKRSVAYKARQGPMKSVFSDGDAQGFDGLVKETPKAFRETAESFVKALRDQLGDNEVRALAADKVASPVLQMLVEVEAGYGMADTPGSLMDRTLVGLITLSHEDPSASPDASDYLTTLLRDPTASHLLEALVRRAPENVFATLWATYFRGKLQKLAIHPVANFVVAKGIERLNADQLGEVCEELDEVFGKIIKNSRVGVLRALVDRAAALHVHEGAVVESIGKAFDLAKPEDKDLAVPCILRLLPVNDYKTALATKVEQPAKPDGDSHRRRGRMNADDDSLEPKTQGALLLQSMLRLASPYNEVVLASIQALSLDDLLAMAHHVTSSRVLDVVLDSPTVPAKTKRKFVLTFLGHFHILVDDRIGSRVGARCWAYADPYLKEKIARSVIPHEHALAGSFYGKYFARSLNLHLLQRNPEQWKDQQSSTKAAPPQPSQPKALSGNVHPTPTTSTQTPAPVEASESGSRRDKKRKHKGGAEDEIDALFDAKLGKKIKKSGLGRKDEEDPEVTSKSEEHDGSTKKRKRHAKDEPADNDLKDVLGAIKAAPKDDGAHRKKKRAH